MASGDGNADCASHKGPGRGNFIFFLARLDSSALGGERQHSGRGGELGGGGCTERRRGLGREKHTCRTWDDIAAAEENCEHSLVKPGRNRWRIVSTVSLNRDEGMGTEDTGS